MCSIKIYVRKMTILRFIVRNMFHILVQNDQGHWVTNKTTLNY